VNRRSLIPGLALILLTLAAYAPALVNGGYVWDDDAHVTDNPVVQNPNGLAGIWFHYPHHTQYFPLTFTSFWLEYQLGGLDPWHYHLINVLLHIGCALMVWRILHCLGLRWAWIAAALFALHPVQVESVAWVTERKNVLSGLMYFASAYFYLSFAGAFIPSGNSIAQPSPKSRWIAYALAIFFFGAALLSKTVTCTMPAALLAIIWWKRRRLTWADIWPSLPFFVAGLGFGFVSAFLEKAVAGTHGEAWQFSLADRALIAGRAFWFYPAKLIWPTYLTFSYPRWNVDSHAAWQYLFPVTALAAMATLFVARKRIGYGPFAAAMFYLATISPMLGLLDYYTMVFSFAADHYQYIACLGLIALFLAVIDVIFRAGNPLGKAALTFTFGLAPVILLILVALTWRLSSAYENAETLWKDLLAKNPGSWMAHNNYGVLLTDQNRPLEAIAQFNAAIAVKPNYPAAYANLGSAYNKAGDAAAAIAACNQSLRLNALNPKAHNNLGSVLFRLGKFDEARPHFVAAIEMDPSAAEPHCNLGALLYAQGQLAAAEQQYSAALALKPSYAEALNGLGGVLMKMGRPADAAAAYQQAIRLNPTDAAAHWNLGTLLANAGNNPLAITEFQAALAANPNYADAHTSLGTALANQGDLAEALNQFQAALRINPHDQDARRNLNMILSMQHSGGR
jgi:tetratricopeptide (TPR) repeat protein